MNSSSVQADVYLDLFCSKWASPVSHLWSGFRSRPASATSRRRCCGYRWSGRRLYLCTAGRIPLHQNPPWDIQKNKAECMWCFNSIKTDSISARCARWLLQAVTDAAIHRNATRGQSMFENDTKPTSCTWLEGKGCFLLLVLNQDVSQINHIQVKGKTYPISQQCERCVNRIGN